MSKPNRPGGSNNRGGKSPSGIRNGVGVAFQGKTKVDEITNKDVYAYLDNREAGYFINAPTTVNVKGVEFNYFTTTEVWNGTKKEYVVSYQSSEQNSKGEYPLLEIHVVEHRRKETKYYTFRNGGTGSRISK